MPAIAAARALALALVGSLAAEARALSRAGHAGGAALGQVPPRDCSEGYNPQSRFKNAYKHRNGPWMDGPVVTPVARERPKLAVLLFVKNRVFNDKLWSAWMQRARREGLNFTVFVHAYKQKNSSDLNEFEKYLVPERAKTDKCNLWDAQMLLVKRALDDPAVTHLITLSENSIPVKPLAHIYAELIRNPVSRLCGDDEFEYPRAETWWMLRREDAQMFRDNRKQILDHFKGGCIDEKVWYWVLKLRMEKFGEPASVSKECVVFTDWKMGSSCKAWADHADLCDCPNLRLGPHKNASGGHPVTFYSVNADGLKELLRSPFWFARKFTDRAVGKEAMATIEEEWLSA